MGREVRAIAASRQSPPADPWAALRLASAGYCPSSGSIYDLRDSGASAYVSDRQRELMAINWPAAGLLDHKLGFFFMLRHFGIPTPEISGVIVRGRVRELGSREPPSADWLRRRLEERGRLVIRPSRGGGGYGLQVLEHSEGAFRISGEDVGWPEVERRLTALGDHLVSDFVEQGAYAREIFPGTTNTVRLLTMLDRDGPFVAAAVHRFGTPASAPADNWSQGGPCARVDPADGTLGPGVSRPRAGPLEWHQRHPATGAALAGPRIPHWPAARDGVLEAAAQLSFLPYVGWDVIITDDGYSVIEGNKNSDLDLLQVHGPMNSDPRVQAFFAEHAGE